MAGAKKETLASENLLKSIEPEPSSAGEPKSKDSSHTTDPKDTGEATDTEAKIRKAVDSKPAASADKDSNVDAPPQRPPRPERKASLFTSNLDELKTAFPDSSIDVCRGMLVAASNNLENAFSGMLAISDSTIRPAAYVREQIAHDEKIARNLAMSEQRRRRSAASRRSRMRDGEDYQVPAAIRDDEPYDGFQKSLSETKQVVSSFWGSLKERISGELHDDDEDDDVLTSREPLKSQWFPRQPSGPAAARSQQTGPRLPPRKSSRPTSGPALDTAAKPPAASAEPRSVNAFGDDSMRAGDVADEQEPDAFFIGESDDDLGSLNDEAQAGPHPPTQPNKSKNEEKKATDSADVAGGASQTTNEASKRGGKESESKAPDSDAAKAEEATTGAGDETRKEDAPSAKQLLSKFKTADKAKT